MDPTVDGGIGLEVRFIEHASDVLGIYLYLKLFSSNKVKAEGTEGSE